jgi:hypothetical protein
MTPSSEDFEGWTDEEKWQFLTRHEKLGEVLVRQNQLTIEQLEELLAEQLEELLAEQRDSGKHIGQLIVSKGLLSIDAILRALNQQHLNDKVSLEAIIELQTKHEE